MIEILTNVKEIILNRPSLQFSKLSSVLIHLLERPLPHIMTLDDQNWQHVTAHWQSQKQHRT